ncbi:MAG: AsmA family protein [Burkholderiaceae bacterium]
MSAESSSITLDFEQPGQRRLAFTIAAPLQVDLAGPKISFKPFKGQLQIDDKAVAPQPLSLPFQETARRRGRRDGQGRLRVDAPDTRLDAKADVAGFAKPRIRFALDADRIDVDRYLPPSDPAKTPPADTAGKAGSQSLFAAVDPIPVDLSPLRELDLAGTLRVGQLKAAGLSIAKLAGDLAASGGVFTLKSLSADLYGGRADVRGSARAQGNRVALATKLSGVNIGPLLKDLTGDTMLEGLANTSIDLAAEGATVGAMRRSVDGSIKLAMTDGAVLGINLAQKLREARQKLGGAGTEAAALDRTQKTDFASLSASFNVRDGVASGDDLEAKSPLLRVGGQGVIDLVRESLDYTVKASVVATAKGQGGADLAELRGLTIPVVLSGALAAPQWKIDWESVARQAIESRAGEKLKQQLEPAKAEAEARIAAEKEALKAREDELKAKARDKLGDKLKGLLTR